MAWTPQQDQLGQLSQCLRDSLSGHDIKAQRNAEQMLQQATTSPDINNYLAWIATTESANTGLSEDNYFSARCAAAIDTILIIEDDQATASFLAAGLKEAGYRVSEAHDGALGLARSLEDEP